MKLDTAALWQTLTKRAAALLADEQKRTGLLVAAGLLGLVLLGVSSWLPAKTEPAAEAAPQATAASAYEADLETRLQSLISNLAGAGETRVMVTLQCGEESIYAADTETSADGTAASKHVITGGSGRAVNARHKTVKRCAVLAARFLRFLRIDGVADHIGKLLPVLFGQFPIGVEFRVRRLFGVLRIDHHLAEPAFYPPNRSCCHRRITSSNGAE